MVTLRLQVRTHCLSTVGFFEAQPGWVLESVYSVEAGSPPLTPGSLLLFTLGKFWLEVGMVISTLWLM